MAISICLKMMCVFVFQHGYFEGENRHQINQTKFKGHDPLTLERDLITLELFNPRLEPRIHCLRMRVALSILGLANKVFQTGSSHLSGQPSISSS
jgi:hypothetical protein